ncbi:response regulator [Massilia sp. TS11]|uniref:response regulator n=1 Tax=Massilia sp. TS11 TaxID=2908003 RepID=UPI001EDA513B|nr:response regulator [Massilia sp. TS11]MCG2584481.1 response regulator [Massilia sp. TS11]
MLKRLLQRTSQLSIALIASAALTTVVTLILLVFAFMSYSGERSQREEALHHDLVAAADQMALSLALPTWNFDDSQVLAVMRSSLNDPDLEAAVVAATANRRTFAVTRAADGSLQVVDHGPNDPELLVAVRPIKIAEQTIGTVSVYATHRLLEEDLRQRRFALGGVILLLDAALVAALYGLIWLLILRPLKDLGHYAAAVKDGGEVGHMAGQDTYFAGELLVLRDAVTEMVGLLDQRYLALRTSEERLSIATRAANIGIWDWNVLTNVLVWDGEMYRQYQLTPAQFDGQFESWTRCILPEDLSATNEAVLAALRGEREFQAEFRILWPNGAIRHLKADAMTVRDPGGRPLRMIGVSYDVTDTKLAQQELMRHRNHLEELVAERTAALSVAVAEAKAANHAKSVFLATMSHELRTPLNSVIGFSRLMANSATMSDEEKRNLSIIHRSGQHLLTLINDILELSKIEAGRVTLQEEAIDLKGLLREVMDMNSARARQGQLRLELDTRDLPPAVRLDGAKLRQVLLNLMSNAVKFVDQGSVTLRAWASPAGPERVRLAFAVKDTGIGISPADQARVFEPFIQGENNSKRDGTGLGLTISREFVRLMGGNLEVESELGKGSEFRFSVEAAIAEALPVQAPNEAVSLPAEQRGKHILIVDDNADGRALLAGLLQPLGFVVDEVGDGVAALAALERHVPDLVIMDWRMPGMDGLTVTRRLRARQLPRQPKVVVLTASAFEDERTQALAAGADDFLRKPIEYDKLCRVLEQQLGLQFERRARREEPVPPPAPPREPTEAELAALAPELRRGLRAALQDLDMEEVERLQASVAAANPALAEAIAQMLGRHQYPRLCALIDACEVSA